MTRREIILQVLSEASGRSEEGVESLLDAMIAEEMISSGGLDEEFSNAEFLRMMEDFRAELPGIRRWLCEAGLLGECGNA
jgi:hypothetical protein